MISVSQQAEAELISPRCKIVNCAGFLRVELESQEPRKRINTLESVAEAKPPSNDPHILIKNAPGKFILHYRPVVVIIQCNHRNKRLVQTKIPLK